MDVYFQHVQNFFVPQNLFDAFEKLDGFTHDIVVLFGKTTLTPRTTIAFGTGEYRYAGMVRKAQPWSVCPDLLSLKEHVERTVDCSFNYALVNKYQNGFDYIGWHSDKEKDMEKDAPIVSLSLGAERKFQVRDKHRGPITTFKLKSGDGIIMRPGAQKLYKHRIPKDPRIKDVRYNITFRKIIQA